MPHLPTTISTIIGATGPTGARAAFRIYQLNGYDPVVVCSPLPYGKDTGVTNLAEHLATEVVKGRGLTAPLMRIWGVSITRNTRGRLGSTYY